MSLRFDLIAFSFGLAAAVGLGCDKTPPPEGPAGTASTQAAAAPVSEGPVRVSGSSALQPLVNAAKEKFEAQNKGASIEVSAGGSKKGLVDVAAGAVQIGDSDIFAAPDQKELVDHKVAVVGFAAMANKGPYNAKVASVGMDQLAKVFTGEIKNWKDLGGSSQPIVVINRAPASGTRTVFGNVVLGGDKFVESQTEDNSGALVAKLKQTPGAISYLALSFKDDELVTLSIKIGPDTVDPVPDTISQGKYPVWSYEHMYTKGEATAGAKRFLDFVLSPDFQSTVLPSVKGFIPITAMKVQRDKD
jgi:phosphate transport system substrate-binding protein